jgi:hypothetical protein
MQMMIESGNDEHKAISLEIMYVNEHIKVH